MGRWWLGTTRRPATAEAKPCIDELFRSHYSKVALWCFRFTGDREEAADLAQAVFLKAYENLSSFQGHSRFSTWLYSIARSECLNAVKSRSTRTAPSGDDLLLALLADTEDNQYRAAERASSLRLAQRLLDGALNGVEKKVFKLHYGDDLPLDAITRLLGLRNTSGAKAYIVSAKRKLGRLLKRWKARERASL